LASYAGILQADAFDGYNRLYLADRKPGPFDKQILPSSRKRVNEAQQTSMYEIALATSFFGDSRSCCSRI
jgi:hypothetical protein